MVERQDIDALLISALYGELTPSEESRLAAHLDAHPSDRTALADLTHARGLVRESRLLQVQLEPPPSVSALLMKEAARCAPKPEAREGWFARFVRSFAAHPAMAAAAMLVVVLGVATLVTRRKADFAESTAPAPSQIALQEQGSATVAAPAAGPSNTRTGDGIAMGSGSASGASGEANLDELEAGAADNFRVALDDGYAQGQAKDQAAAVSDKRAEKQKTAVTVTKPAATLEPEGKLAKEQAAVTGAKKAPRQGIELRAPQPAPKDFEADTRRKGTSESKNTLAFGDNDSTLDSKAESTGAPGGAGATAGIGRAQEPTATTADASRAPARPAPPRATNASPPPPPASSPKPDPRRDAPAKTVDRNASPRAATPAEEKPADPQLAWARDQHAALIAQVRAGECKKAATIATSISNRAPAYYQQNVETDRAVKACIVYINNERERDAEQRSERARANQKRSVNEPAKAAPTTTDTK